MRTQDNTIYNKAQILELERLAGEQYNLPAEQLMQHAGQAAFETVKAEWPSAKNLTIFCGAGNNAGDGYILAWLAHQAHYIVQVVYLTSPNDLKDAALAASSVCKDAGVEFIPFGEHELSHTHLIVDAILGTGISREVEGTYREAIVQINQSEKPVFSIDIPSGMGADSGCAQGVAIDANVTLTFLGLKQGLLTGHGPAYSGKILCDDLGLPKAAYDQVNGLGQVILEKSIRKHLKPRRRDVYKGQCGHVLIIGGDHGMAGAAAMAASAAYRMGAGLVSVATRPEHVSIITSMRPEAMCHEVQAGADLYGLLRPARIIVVGPGLARGRWGRDLFEIALQSKKPMVVDADALNILADKKMRRDDWVLTPHAGEASRLLGYSAGRIQANRFSSVDALAKKYGGVAVLKGTGTLVHQEGEPTQLCTAGNPGMATGGMGDILSGVIGGLIAQGLSLFDAATFGVYLHSKAADIASQDGERGMVATDLLPILRKLANVG